MKSFSITKYFIVCFFIFSMLSARAFFCSYGLDRYLVEYLFPQKKNGFFFEIGANDGITDSSAYFLEKNRGWRGICIEAQSDKFNELVKNRVSTCLHCAVFDRDGVATFLQVTGGLQGYSGLFETYGSEQRVRVEQLLKKNGGRLIEQKIATRTVNSICKQYAIKHIDFLSIDTEGSEIRIIKSIDLKNIDISVIIVENNYGDTSLKKYLHSQGYQYLCSLFVDDVYKKGFTGGKFDRAS